MSSSLTMLVVAGVLISAGVYLMMERSLTRILVGVLLAGNGVNLLFLVASGTPAGAPFVDSARGRDISDPLPQAMVLTAIVITLGLTAFLLTMAYRSFQLHGHDEVADDVEDRRIVRLAEADRASASYDEDDKSLPSEDDTDPDPAEEGSAEQEAERAQRRAERERLERERAAQGDGGERARRRERELQRDSAEDAVDEIIGRGGRGTGS